MIAGVAGSDMTGELVIWHEDRENELITLKLGMHRTI